MLNNIDMVNEIFKEREKHFDINVIKCTFSVDAFSVNHFSNSKNYSFNLL